MQLKQSQSLDLLRLLDAIGRWNSWFDEPTAQEQEPEETSSFTIDSQTSGYIARQLGMYAPFVYECLAGLPVKEGKGVRDWLISKMDLEPDFDALKAMYRYAKRHGISVDHEAYLEAREDQNERIKAMSA